MKTTITDRDAFVAHIVSRVWKDEGYKQRLLKDPKAVLAEELGTQISEKVEVRVLEETPNVRYLVIPYSKDRFRTVTEVELLSASGSIGVATVTSTAISSPCDCG
ncbi:NHLP leader peptide family RiPP precursor [Sorangium sp. So ce448]|uniref:NHLP leader peptide family RiPP precursor n=1 Tax=Sorangium sp. So ce448 TaxID=3133314 RepID=UPI003F637CBA